MTDAMIRISARNANTKEELAEVLSGRVHALASAHSLVRRDFSSLGTLPNASELGALVRAICLPHDDGEAGTPRISIQGPSVPCGEHACNGIALVFHELATNAAKYGALKVENGRVDVSWLQEDDMIVVRWIERGGPHIGSEPAVRGFGSTLVQTTVARQFGGSLDYEWQPMGLTATIRLPLQRLSL